MKNLHTWFLGVLGLLVLGVTTAQAAIPAIVGTTLTSVQVDGLAMIDLVWPVMITLFGGILLIKIFKRAANKV